MTGKLWVVGIGPGAYDDMTLRAAEVLSGCEVIVGYSTYIELVRPFFPKARFISSPMRREKERCETALDEAESGKNTALICSGDAGVYGLAGIVLPLAQERGIETGIVPGVTAAQSGAALLGAPLMQDYCVISLSDLQVPWDVIEKRLAAAAGAGMAICLYNPGSRGRKENLEKACRVLLEILPGDAVCGIASRISREGENCRVLSLQELCSWEAGMFDTVFIGTEKTGRAGGRMVTARA